MRGEGGRVCVCVYVCAHVAFVQVIFGGMETNTALFIGLARTLIAYYI